MTFAIERPIQQKPLSFDDFIAQYGGDNRYELIDGEVFDLEPTGPHEQVAAFLDRKLNVQIDQLDLPYFVYLVAAFCFICFIGAFHSIFNTKPALVLFGL